MKHLKILNTLLAGIILLTIPACRKDGVNKNLDPNAQHPYDFMSTKNGSYWTYGGRDGVVYTRYARNKDTIKNTLKYSYFERQEGTGASFTPEYFGKNGNYYICLLDLDGNETSYLEYVYGKEDAALGEDWTNTGSVYHPLTGNVNMSVKSTLSETGLTVTHGSRTFNSVMHVHSDIKAGAFNVSIGTLDIWFVKGFGIIRQEADINVMSFYSTQHTDSLIDYHIVP